MSLPISIITIANNKDIYNGFIENLNTQKDLNFELITVSNFDNKYTSARQALNEAALQVHNPYIVFSHQDIRFLDSYSLRDMLTFIESISDFGVVGVAGAKSDLSKNKQIILTNIVHGERKENIQGQNIENAIEVQTVDECLFFVKKEYFDHNKFKNIDGWHLYAVEYCLEALKNGMKNYVVPARLWHMSDGKRSLSKFYMDQLEDLINREKDSFTVFYTTIKMWKTKGVFSFIYRKYYRYKQIIKRKLLGG